MKNEVLIARRSGFFVDDPVDLAENSAFLEDARGLAKIDEARFRAAVDALNASPGFVSTEQLENLLSDSLGDKQEANTLLKFVLLFTRLSLQGETTPKEMFEALPRALDAKNALSTEERAELLKRLQLLITPSAAVRRHAKARELASALGHPLEELQIVCDLRPVFDSERKVIEGMFPIATLKTVVTGDTGLPVESEIVLSRAQIDDLAIKAAQAKTKLDALADFLKTKGVSQPEME